MYTSPSNNSLFHLFYSPFFSPFSKIHHQKMENFGENTDAKSNLVNKICSISTSFATCPHLCHRSKNSSFVDWYRVLQVNENAGIDTVRKQYRQLALQVHPDKNRHPKADIAFKLISEAYACLSDKTKRKSFECKRSSNFCKECNKKTQLSIPRTHNFPNILDPEKPKKHYPTVRSRTNKFLWALNELRERFKEEVKVIERGLRSHEAPRRELPLFDPSNYVFSNYPHRRTHPGEMSSLDSHMIMEFWYIRNGYTENYYRGRPESPVYEIKPQSQSIRSREARFRF